MRAAPSITTYNPSAANANGRDTQAAANVTVAATAASDSSLQFTFTGVAGTAVGNALVVHYTASAEL